MLRELINHGGKAAETTYVASVEMKTGMGAVKNLDGTASFPAAPTSANIFLVDKERIPTGVNAGKAYLSDYENEFVTVFAGDRVKLPEYDFGEVFGTDQFAESLVEGDAGKTLHVGVDGKWAVASAPSVYLFQGFIMDAGVHKMAKIAVLKDAVANAAAAE